MQYLKCIFLYIFLIISVLGRSQTECIFPDITGESLYNETVKLPIEAKGKYCLIGMASSKQAEQDLQSWMQPVYDLFINQNTFIPINYNVKIYFIPMFSGTNQIAYNKIMKRTKRELASVLQPYVIFCKGNIAEYKNTLEIKDKNKPYFFVLDKRGKIVYFTSGRYTSKKLDEMEEIVSK
jgi:hypothetical protein